MKNLVTMLPLAKALNRRGTANHAEKGFEPEVKTSASTMRFGKVGLHAATLALGFAMLAPVAARAYDVDDYRSSSGWQSLVDGRLVDVSLKVDGETAPLYFSPRFADQRRYLEAYAGRNYSIVLRNNSNRRIGVLIAVDGLNVVNGERSRLSASEAMYVLDPYERTEIRGWRTSLDQVRRFVFVDEKRSYAERTGQANSDMGWIRVLSFNEQRLAWGYGRPSNLRDNGSDARGDAPRSLDKSRESEESRGQVDEAPAPASPKAGAAPQPTTRGDMGRNESNYAPKQDGGSFPGTGWGDRQHDPVQQTEFRAERNAVDRIIVRYEYASGLRALGIDPSRGWREDRLGQRDGGGDIGFARPPRW